MYPLILLTVAGVKYKTVAKFARDVVVGEYCFMWGSPLDFTDILRQGHVAGFYGENTVFDMTATHGDSGGAIFNGRGLIIGVVWGGPDGVPLEVGQPIGFTDAQIREANA